MVVLPAPVAPTTATVWPAGIAQVEVVQHGAVAVAELHALEADLAVRRGRAASGSIGLGHAGRLVEHAASFSSDAAAAWNRL